MSRSSSSDDRFFPNVFPRDIGDNKDKIMDSDNKKVELKEMAAHSAVLPQKMLNFY